MSRPRARLGSRTRASIAKRGRRPSQVRQASRFRREQRSPSGRPGDPPGAIVEPCGLRPGLPGSSFGRPAGNRIDKVDDAGRMVAKVIPRPGRSPTSLRRRNLQWAARHFPHPRVVRVQQRFGLHALRPCARRGIRSPREPGCAATPQPHRPAEGKHFVASYGERDGT